MVWDRGHYTCDEDPERAVERGSIRFDLFGEKTSRGIRARADEG
jgi:hypothetical protein